MLLSRVSIVMSAAAFVAALFPAAASAAGDASAIIAKHTSYVGQPQGLVLTYRYEGKTATTPAAKPAKSADADAAPTVTTYRRGAVYRRVGGSDSSESGFTGRAFWAANENGYTVVEYEDAARRRLTANIVTGNLLADVPASLRSSQTIDGVAVDVVRIAPPSGIPADIAFDRATGAYVQVTYDPDNGYGRSVVHYDGYTEVAPGVRVPSAYHNSDDGRWKLTEHAVRAVTNDDLRGPVPTAKWNFVSSDATPIDLVEHQTPYAFLPRGQAVEVRATIQGHPGRFLLDSGASGIILYRPYADALKLEMLGRSGFRGVNGVSIDAQTARVPSIELGKNSLNNVIVTVAPPAPIDPANLQTKPVDGILGYDFLAGALVDVDTANRTIRILDPSVMEPAVAKGAYAFTVNLATRQPEIVLRVNNVTTRAIFDTGNDFLAVLSDDLKKSGRIVALNDVLNAGGGQTADYMIGFMGVDGPSNIPAQCSRLNEIIVGPYRYQNVETCFGPASVFGRDGGLIGFDFLKHFNWTFDYPESKLVLTPNGK
jgi:predicted aspartyl protease